VVAGAVAALGATLTLALGTERAGAGAGDSAAVRGYIVPTANNPDVNPAPTCQGTFTANDQSDDQAQSPPGTTSNAVTLAGCSYDAPPYGGPSTEDRPVVFQVTSGPGGLLCGAGTQQSQACALSGINYAPGGEYRVLANNEAGVNATGTMRVQFCADDPPVDGLCTSNDEQGTAFTIRWEAGGGKCAGKTATIVASGGTTKGTGGNDVIVGSGANDTIKGKGGKDRICGKGGKDKLKGGGGNDNLKGGGGKDRLNGGPGTDTCKGGGGKDKLRSCEKGD
jgi:Ca2+-binding RTX toxin-like protein